MRRIFFALVLVAFVAVIGGCPKGFDLSREDQCLIAQESYKTADDALSDPNVVDSDTRAIWSKIKTAAILAIGLYCKPAPPAARPVP